MALDWSKEISFSGLKKGAGRRNDAMPSKTGINLVASEKSSSFSGRNVVIAVVLVAAVALFLKFGVFDLYGQVDAKRAELNAQQQQLASIRNQLAGYDDLLAEYESYGAGKVAEGVKSVDVTVAFRLVDECVAPYASVSSLGLVEDELMLQVADTTLDRVGAITSALEQQPEVSEVSVSNATTKQSSGGAAATVMVKLQPVLAGQGA